MCAVRAVAGWRLVSLAQTLVPPLAVPAGSVPGLTKSQVLGLNLVMDLMMAWGLAKTSVRWLTLGLGFRHWRRRCSRVLTRLKESGGAISIGVCNSGQTCH